MANNFSNYAVIDVTPTLHTSEYASGDIMFNRVEIPNAVLGKGGCSKLLGITINSKKASDTTIIVYLLTNDQSVGSANDAMNISAADGSSAGFLGYCNLVEGGVDLGDFVTMQTNTIDDDKHALPMLLQAAAGSTSVYFFASTLTVQTYAANDLTFRFHIQYK